MRDGTRRVPTTLAAAADILGGTARECAPMPEPAPTIISESVPSSSLILNEDARPTLAPRAGRGPVALVADVTLGPEAELTAFVRRRVRQVSVLFLAGYVVFLVRELFAPHR